MKLYGFPASTNTWMARAVAAQLDIPMDFKVVNLMQGESHTPEFLQLNPTGRVPVLVDDDFVLWEANAITQYLASKEPSSLYPDDVNLRAQIMQWQSWQLAHWTAGCQPLQYETLVKPQLNLGDPDQVAIEKATTLFHKEASVLNQHLSDREYLVGDGLTIADFAVASYLVYAEPAGFPMEDYGNIRQWLGRVITLPAWQDTAPQM